MKFKLLVVIRPPAGTRYTTAELADMLEALIEGAIKTHPEWKGMLALVVSGEDR